MKAFVVPVYIQTNSLSLEKITLGLLGLSPKHVFFHASAYKISVAENLIKNPVKKFLQETVALLQKNIYEININFNNSQTNVFPSKGLFHIEHLEFLKQYSQGLIQFGEPMPVSISLDEQSFNALFKAFVGEEIAKPALQNMKSLNAKVKEALNIPGLEKKADLDYRIKQQKIGGLLKDVTVTLLTKNGSFQGVQSVDFNNSEITVANRIYEYEVLVNILNQLSIKKFGKKGKFKIVAEKPEGNSGQFSLYNQVYREKKNIFQLISPEELSVDAQRIVNMNYEKASSFL